MKRRIRFALVSLASLLLFCGCGNKSADGFEEIKAARKGFEELSSAYITLTDIASGFVVKALVFRFDGEKLTYYLMETDGDNIYHEYYDTKTLCTATGEDDRWTEITSDDQRFKKYDRTLRPKFMSRTLLYYEPESIAYSTIGEGDTGYQINFVYDTAKMSPSFYDFFELDEKLSTLTTNYLLDSEMRVKRIQHFGKLADGELNYQIDIDNMNGVPKISKPNLQDYKRKK